MQDFDREKCIFSFDFARSTHKQPKRRNSTEGKQPKKKKILTKVYDFS
jgi:hypothetical protein